MAIMGDLNAVMDINLDKSNLESAYSVIPQMFSNWLANQGLSDTWHAQYAQILANTFFPIATTVFQESITSS